MTSSRLSSSLCTESSPGIEVLELYAMSGASESLEECHEGRRNRPIFAHPLGTILELGGNSSAFIGAASALVVLLLVSIASDDSLSMLFGEAYRRSEILKDGH